MYPHQTRRPCRPLRRRVPYSLRIERLEDRLPPGDVLGPAWTPWWGLSSTGPARDPWGANVAVTSTATIVSLPSGTLPDARPTLSVVAARNATVREAEGQEGVGFGANSVGQGFADMDQDLFDNLPAGAFDDLLSTWFTAHRAPVKRPAEETASPAPINGRAEGAERDLPTIAPDGLAGNPVPVPLGRPSWADDAALAFIMNSWEDTPFALPAAGRPAATWNPGTAPNPAPPPGQTGSPPLSGSGAAGPGGSTGNPGTLGLPTYTVPGSAAPTDDCGNGPVQSAAGAPTSSPDAYSAASVRYFDGTVRLTTDDLRSAGFGTPWRHELSWTNAVGYAPIDRTGRPMGFNGNGMVVHQLPYMLSPLPKGLPFLGLK